MSECEYCHEDFCILQEEYPQAKRCKHAKGELPICTAKETDLIALCPDCETPTSQCDCGTCWVLVTDKRGNVAIMQPKEFSKLKEEKIEYEYSRKCLKSDGK